MSDLKLEQAIGNAELVESQAFNSLILKSSRDCIVVLDLDGNNRMVSPGGIEAMEIENVGAIIGLSWLRVWHGDDRIKAEAALASARSGKTARFQGYCPTHKGTPKWWDMLISPLGGTEGSPEYLVSFGRDITDLKRAELKSALSEDRYQLIAEVANGIGWWDWDIAGDKVISSKAFAESYGVPGALAEQGLPIDIYTQAIHPDDRHTVMAAVERTVKTGVPFSASYRVTDVRGAERWIHARGHTTRDKDGRALRFTGVSVDITEQQALDRKLELTETSLRLTTEAAEVGIWDLDLITDTLTWSDRTKALFGISPGMPCAMADFYDGLHPDDREATSAAFAAALDPARRLTYDVEYRTVGKEDGLIRWVAAKGKGIFDASGRCVRAVGTAIDITGRKTLEEQRVLLAEELQHRIKNLLAMVQGIATQTFREGVAFDVAKKLFIGRLQALSAAQDVLLGRAEAADGIRSVVQAALEPHGGSDKILLEGPGIRVGPKAMLGLSLTLHELATNAVKYGSLSNDDGRIEVRWTIEHGEGEPHVVLEWRESGGPVVTPPIRKGFGSLMIERSLAGYLGGTSTLLYEPSGVVFRHRTRLVDMEAE